MDELYIDPCFAYTPTTIKIRVVKHYFCAEIDEKKKVELLSLSEERCWKEKERVKKNEKENRGKKMEKGHEQKS